MCGRYTLKSPADLIREIFELPQLPGLTPRYNIAPTQPVPVVRLRGGERRLDLLHWGLVPHWALDRSVGNRMINARSETAAERPAFRDPFARRRCLVPADGFYEWQRLSSGRKQPFHIHLRPERPFAFAGLWDRWRSRRDDTVIESCAILTTDANDLVAPIHDRMPAILTRAAARVWLDPDTSATQLAEIIAPFAGAMEATPVSVMVNDPRNDDPRCLTPVVATPVAPTLFD